MHCREQPIGMKLMEKGPNLDYDAAEPPVQLFILGSLLKLA